MQKDPSDSRHLSYLAGSTGYPGILPPDRGVVVDIEICCVTGLGVARH